MIDSRIQYALGLAALLVALGVLGLGCNGGGLSADSLSFPKDKSAAPASAAPAQPAPAPTEWTAPEPATAQFEPGADSPYSWAELSARGRDAMLAGDYPTAKSAFVSALSQTATLEDHDVRVKTSLVNITVLAQALDAEGSQDQSAELVQILIVQEQADRRINFDVAGPLMLSHAERELAAGNPAMAAQIAQAALNLDGSSNPINASLREKLDAMVWPVSTAPSAE
ncbi:MAG: hypothetical protein OSB70_00755 [Myxococcota bacterium]|nr:hypothetical protein [Myxococcota bacterium]